MMLDDATNNRGMALVVTLGIIAVIAAAVLEYSRRTMDAAIISKIMRDRITASHIAESGLNAAIALLAKDAKESETDTLNEDWAQSDVLEKLAKELSFEDAELSIKITDERGKIQINALVNYPEGKLFSDSQKIVWDRMLRFFSSASGETDPDSDPTAIIESLKDWLDYGDDDAISGLNGAESPYYLNLSPPYPCANGPMLNVDDIYAVKGIKKSLFEKFNLTESLKPYMEKLPDDLIKPDITSFLTVYGMTGTGGKDFTFDGKININTASMPVLAAIAPSENPDIAVSLYRFRSEFQEISGKQRWWEELPGGKEIDSNLITTHSDCFRIEAAAVVRGVVYRTEAVVRRNIENTPGIPMITVLSRTSS